MRSRTEAALALWLAAAAPVAAGEVPEASVAARAGTAPLHGGADDPAIRVDAADPAASRILGTGQPAGVRLHDLSGALVAARDDGRLDLVDVRSFAGTGALALAGATRRDDGTLVLRSLSADGTRAPAGPFALPVAPPDLAAGTDDAHGFAPGRDPATGETRAFANFKSGHVLPWRISAARGFLR